MSSPLQTQQFRWGGSLHPIFHQPPDQPCPNERFRLQRMNPLQLLLKLQDPIPTSHKLIPSLPPFKLKNSANNTGGITSPHILPATTPILARRTISSPARDSSTTSIKVTRQSYNSLTLHTIPPIEISSKFTQVGNRHLRSPPPPALPWSNEASKHRRIHCP
jgi:hypothetical protein